jgi:F0F1-type ATP synthase membrane subunit b/b'
MKRKGRPEPKEESSLLPSVGEREEELGRMLHEAKTEAERMLAEARREAASAVESAREEIPRSMSRKREETMARIETEIAGLGEALDREERAVELEAEKNLEKAVSLIVSAVWPRGE